MNRDIIKINLKLLNYYNAEIDLLFEQIKVLESILEYDEIDYVEICNKFSNLGVKNNKISKPVEMLIFNKDKKISKDSIRSDIYDMANKLNKLILIVESIENVYKNLKDDYKIVFQLSFKNDFYDYETKLKIFKDFLNCDISNSTLKRKYENIKTRLIDIFSKDINVLGLIKNL